MKRYSLILAATLAALPLVVAAQTTNTPGGSASTGTPLDQTKGAPSKTAPSTTGTSPSTTNPSGSLSGGGAMSSGSDVNSTTKSTSKPKTKMNKSNTPPAGEVPTYPAPAPDGTPTK